MGTTTTATTTTTTATDPGDGARDDADDNRGDQQRDGVQLPSRRGRSRNSYAPIAYEPEPISYADLIRRATWYPRWRTHRSIAAPRIMLLRQAGEAEGEGVQGADSAEAEAEAEVRPAAAAAAEEEEQPSLELVLGRAAFNLDQATARMEPIVSAISADISGGLVPLGHKNTHHGPAALRSHHLGRCYADSPLCLSYERRQVDFYLRRVAALTARARRYVAAVYVNRAHQALRAQRDAVGLAIEEHRGAVGAAAHGLARELRAARVDGDWRRVWELEKKLATTASLFLASEHLVFAWDTLPSDAGGRVTEISMARMAGWYETFAGLYREDARRALSTKMDVVERYRAIFSEGPTHHRPWKGESRLYTLSSPTGAADDDEFVVLRHDQNSKLATLWPRAWKPIRPAGSAKAGSEPAGPAEAKDKKEEGRTAPTSPGAPRFRIRKIKGAHTGQGQRPLDTRADSEVPDA